MIKRRQSILIIIGAIALIGTICMCLSGCVGFTHDFEIGKSYFVDPQTGGNYIETNNGICPRYDADGSLYVTR